MPRNNRKPSTLRTFPQVRKYRDSRRVVSRPLAMAVAACFGAGYIGSAAANPVSPVVTNGAAQFTTTGNLLTVTNTPNAIINWSSFSIGANEITRFAQQSASSTVLNRVVGQNPSSILGALQSNGRVFLINPNGIVFGAGSQINVAGLVASTLNLSDADFLAGRLKFADGLGNSLINSGTITSGSGGSVYLVGSAVTNNGLITSPKGEVVLAAGNSVELVNPGTPDLRVQITAPDNQAVNLGGIVAESGRVGIYAGLINHAGSINADSVTVGENGQITLKATGNTTLQAGSTLTANGPTGGTITVQSGDTTLAYGNIEAKGSAGQGGEVKVLGNLVGLVDDARVDASGASGGGVVLVGGDFQGKNADVQNAYRTYVSPQATIKADATDNGNGGKVVVWADDVTRYYGDISARGGAQSGSGGNVEVSGHNYLDYRGTTNTTAVNGSTGSLLLDPSDIDINATDNITPTVAGGTATFSGASGASAISVGTLTGNATGLGVNNVILDATAGGGGTGTITVSVPITYSSTKSLTFKPDSGATGKVNVNNAITNSAAGNITFDGSVDIAAGISTLGQISLAATTNANPTMTWTAGTIAAAGGVITPTTGTGSILIQGVGVTLGTALIPTTFTLGRFGAVGVINAPNKVGSLVIATGSQFIVDTNGNLAVNSTTAAPQISGGGTLTNNGTVRTITNGSGVASEIATTFNNNATGTVQIGASLKISGSGTDTGNYEGVASGGTPDLNFSAGTRTIAGTFSYTGSSPPNANSVTVSGTADVQFNGSVTVPGNTTTGSINVTGGSAKFNNNVTATNNSTFSGGATTFKTGTTTSLGTGTVAVSGATTTVQFDNAVTLPGTVNVSNGSVTFNNTATLTGTDTFSGGTTTFNAAANWTGAAANTFTVSGSGILNGTGDITLNGGVPAAGFIWSGGTIGTAGDTSTLTTNAVASVTGGVALNRNWTMLGNGTISGAGTVAIADTKTWAIGDPAQAPTPVLTLSSSGLQSVTTGKGMFKNTSKGSITLTAGATIGDGDGLFVNDGVVTLPQQSLTVNTTFGTLQTDTGSYNLNNTNGGYSLTFTNGSRAFVGANAKIYSSNAGGASGDVSFFGGSATFDANAVYDGANISSTRLGGGGQTTVTFNTTNPVTFANKLQVVQDGILTGTANLVTNGPLDWSGGTIGGTGTLTSQTTTPAITTTTISGAVNLNRDWTLAAKGDIGTGGAVTIGSTSTMTVSATNGTLGLSSTSGGAQIAGAGKLVNAGIINVNEVSTIGDGTGQFTNGGTVNVGISSSTGRSLTINTTNGTQQTDTGVYALNGLASSAAYDLTFQDGDRKFSGAGAGITSPSGGASGGVVFSGGSVNLGTSIYSGTLVASTTVGGGGTTALVTMDNNVTFTNPLTVTTNGTLTGLGNLTANGAFTWSGGNIATTGTGTLTTNGTIALSGALLTLDRSWTYGGTGFGYTGPLTLAGSGLFNNTGTINVNGGNLTVNVGGTDTGTYVVSAPNKLGFGGTGTRNINTTNGVNGSGDVSLGGAAVVVGAAQGINTTGTLTVSGGSLAGTGTASVKAATLDWSGGTITNTNLPLTVTGNTTIGAVGTVLLNNNSNDFGSVAGTVTITNNGGNATVTDANAIALNASTVGGTLQVTSVAAAGVTLNGNVTSTGSQTYTGDVILNAATVILNAGALNNISLGRVAGAGKALTTTGTTSITNTASNLGALTVNQALTTGGAIGAASVTVAGGTTLGGNVTTTGAAGQTYTGGVTLAATPITLDAGAANNISLGVVTGAGNALNTTGNTSITNTTVGSNLGALAVTGTLTTGGAIGATSVSVSGASTLGGSVTTTGNQSYGAATIAGNDTLTASGAGSTVTFNSTVDGAAAGTQTLTVAAPGLTTFTSGVGGGKSLASLAVSGPVSLGGSVTTTGNQSYGAATIAGNDTLTASGAGSTVTFNSTVDGAAAGTQVLTVTAPGLTTFTSGVGGGKSLASLAVSGPVSLGGSVTTTGNQSYGAATIAGNDTLNASGAGSAVTFNSTVDGATAGSQALTVTATGKTTFSSGVGGGKSLASLAVSGPVSLGGSVTTTGNQSYGAATITASDTLAASGAGSTVTFSSTVDGATVGSQALTVTAPGLTTFTSGVGGGKSLASLAVSGPVSLGGSVTTTGNQSYGAATIAGNDTLTASGASSTVTFNSTVDGAAAGTQALTVTTTGKTTFSSGVGGGKSLASLAVSGPVSLGGSVTTTGNQSYGAATIAGNDTLSSSGGTIVFNSTVDGAAAGTQVLTVTTTGKTTFSSGVGGGKSLASLAVSGPVSLGGSVTTTGNQSYGAATIAGNDTLTASGASSTVTFNSTVDGAAAGTQVLIVTAPGLTTFGSGVGGGKSLASLAVSGPASLGGNVTTTGNQTYTGGVTLAATPITLDAGATNNISLGTVTGAGKNLTTTGNTSITSTASNLGVLTANQSLTSGGAIGATSVTVAGAAALSGNVTTTGAQSYGSLSIQNNNAVLTTSNSTFDVGGATTLGKDLTVTTGTGAGGGVTFVGAISGPGALTVNSGAATTFVSSVGGNTPTTRLASLTTDPGGSVVFAVGGPVRTVGDITLNEAVTGAGVTLDSTSGVITATSGSNVLTGTLTVNGSKNVSISNLSALTTVLNDTTGPIVLTAGGAISATGQFSNISASSTAPTQAVSLTSSAPTFTVAGAKAINAPITLKASAGDLVIAGNVDSGGGVFNTSASGTQTLQSGNVSVGSYTLTATGGALTVQGGSLAVSGTLTNNTSLTLGTGNPIISAGNVVNNGTLSLGTGGQTLAAGSSLQNNGLLKGTGTIQTSGGTGTVTNNGIVAPGNSPGTITIGGNFTTTGTLNMEVGGTTPGIDSDRIVVTGLATLGGVLNVIPIGTFVPTSNAGINLINAGSRSGTFSTTNLPLAFAGVSVTYGSTFVDLLIPAQTSLPNDFYLPLLAALQALYQDETRDAALEELKKILAETCN